MAGPWLYSISKRPGYHFNIDGKKIPVTIDSYRDLIESGQLGRDRGWHLAQHWDHVEVGDNVFIYTGNEDFGILGFATVARVRPAKQTMDLNFDLAKCKMLLRRPVPASKVRRWKLNLLRNVVDLSRVTTRLYPLLPWKGTFSQGGGENISRQMQRRGNAPTDRMFEYWVKGNRTVEPLHDRLQRRFVEHLKAQGISPKENEAYIDVRYTVDGLKTLCEVKPTDNVETRYAIRAAIGQLLEYRFKSQITDAATEIVLGCKPKGWEIAFAKSLRIAVTYFEKATGSFVRA